MREFRIMHGGSITSIPWALIEPHAQQADKNHYQSLQELHERGGLSPCEAVAVISDRPWHKMDNAETELRELVAKFNEAQTMNNPPRLINGLGDFLNRSPEETDRLLANFRVWIAEFNTGEHPTWAADKFIFTDDGTVELLPDLTL